MYCVSLIFPKIKARDSTYLGLWFREQEWGTESERGKQRKSVQDILSRWPLLPCDYQSYQVTGCPCWTLWDNLWNVSQSGLLRRRKGVAFIQWISFPISQSSLCETLTSLHFQIAFVGAVSSLPSWPVRWYQKSVGRKQEIFSAGWRWGAVRFHLHQAGQNLWGPGYHRCGWNKRWSWKIWSGA